MSALAKAGEQRGFTEVMDPARLQSILAGYGSRSQLLTYIRLRYAA
jgi:hypothetical protein